MSAAQQAQALSIKAKTINGAEATNIYEHLRRARRSGFIWGDMGVAKSAIAKRVALMRGVAFCDIRLSQINPADLRGYPYKVEENGITVGVSMTPPMMLPKDIDFERSMAIEAMETTIKFRGLNPISDNGIHHCQSVDIKLRSLTKGLTALLVEESLDRFVAKLVDTAEYEAAKAQDDIDLAEIAKLKAKNPDAGSNFIPAVDMLEAREGRFHYHITGEANALIVFEELNSGVQAVQAAAYQIILDWRQGEYVVPKGCQIMALGNYEKNRGVFHKMGYPLLNRFLHYDQVLTTPEWIEYAITEMFDASIVGFIEQHKDSLNARELAADARAFETARSWHMLSDVFNANPDMSEEEEIAHTYGAVGAGQGMLFLEHRRVSHKLPSNEDILSGRLKKMPGEALDIGASMTLATRLCYELKYRNDDLIAKGIEKDSTDKARVEWFDASDNFIAFVEENMRSEIAIMVMKSSVRLHELPFHTQRMKNFTPFARKYAKFITGKS